MRIRQLTTLPLLMLLMLLALPLFSLNAQPAPPSPPITPFVPPPPPSLAELAGKWTGIGDNPEITVSNNTVTMKGKYTWTGTYDAPHGILHLIYTPKPLEMSAKSPLWARKQVAGKLIWTMDLTATRTSYALNSVRLQGDWIRGEVDWDKTTGANTGATVDLKARVIPNTDPKTVSFTRQGMKITAAFEVSLAANAVKLPGTATLPANNNFDMPVAQDPVSPDDRILFVYGSNFPRDRSTPLEFSSKSAPDVTGYELVRLSAENDLATTPSPNDEWMNQYWRAALATTKSNLPAGIKPPNIKDAMLLRAHLGKALPGFKDLTVNGQSVNWFLHRGTINSPFSFVRKAPPASTGASPRLATLKTGTEDTQEVFVPEQIMIEIRPEVPLPKIATLNIILGGNDAAGKPIPGASAFLSATPVPGFPQVYRTPPINLVDPRNYTPPTTAPAKPSASAASTPISIPVKDTDTLHALLSPDGLLRVQPYMAKAAVARTPARFGSLWKEALVKAANAYKVDMTQFNIDVKSNAPMSEAQADSLSSYVFLHPPSFMEGGGLEPYTPEVRTVQLKLGHIAAMILLKDTFKEMMIAHKAELPDIKSGFAMDNFLDYMRPRLIPSNPLANTKVPPPYYQTGPLTSPDLRSQDVPLYQVFDDSFLIGRGLKSRNSLAGSTASDYQRSSFAIAYGKYKDAIDYAIRKADNTDISDAAALLTLVGYHFEPVIDRLLPRLMKLDDSHPPALTWIPDETARYYVVSIPAFADEYKANRAAAEADTQLMLAVGSLLPFAPVGTLAKTILSMALNTATIADLVGNQLPGYFANQAEQKFAAGATAVLGVGRLNEAQANEKSLGAIMAGLAMSGYGLSQDLQAAAALVPGAEALERGPALAAIAEREGLDAVKAMSPEDQATLYAYLQEGARAADAADAAATAAAETGTAATPLTPEMQAAADAAKKAEANAKNALSWYIAKDASPELADFENLTRTDPSKITNEMIMDLKADPAAMRSLKGAPEDVRVQFNTMESNIYATENQAVLDHLKTMDRLPDGSIPEWAGKDLQVEEIRTPGSDPKDINTDRDFRIVYKGSRPDPELGGDNTIQDMIEVPRKYWKDTAIDEFAKATNYNEDDLRRLASPDENTHWDDMTPKGKDGKPLDPQDPDLTPEQKAQFAELHKDQLDTWAELHQQLGTDRYHPEASAAFSDQFRVDDFKAQLTQNNVLAVKKGDALLKDATGFGMMFDEKADAYLRLTSAEYPDGNKLEAMAQMKKGVDQLNGIRDGYNVYYARFGGEQAPIGTLSDRFNQAGDAIKSLAPYDKTITPDMVAGVEQKLNDLGFNGLADFKNALHAQFDSLGAVPPPKLIGPPAPLLPKPPKIR